MRGLGTFSHGGGAPFPGWLEGDGVVDLSGDFACARDALGSLGSLGGGSPSLAVSDLRVHVPVEPRQIIQSGANYRRHVLELAAAEGARDGRSADEVRAEALRVMDERLATGEPYLFLGAVSALCGAYDDVVLPVDGSQHDWELELAAVIGPSGDVAGYTIANDLTTRDRVYRPDMGPLGTDWLRSKNAPTFLPVGPVVVPAADVDWRDLRIALRLNGDAMQDESTADMLYGVPQLVAYAASRLRLLAGDLLLTGSPAGNGAHYGRFLRPGDVMESTITGLGRQRNRVVARPR